MPLQESPLWLSVLLSNLEAAVHQNDRIRALQVEQTILQRLTTEAALYASAERQVRALIAELDERALTNFLRVDGTEPELKGIGPSENSYDEIAVANDHKGIVYPVWFGTNRKPTSTGEGFTNERADHITFGRALVHVPESHRFGEIGNPFWRRLLRFQIKDDHLQIQRIEEQEKTVFFSELQAEITAAEENGLGSHALVFIHGFNVKFDDAAIRAAQIGVDLKVPGATAFFSWPSRGTVAAYPVDEATIEASESAITEFLVQFTTNCGAEKVHVVAHSMGNRGLLRALQRISGNAKINRAVKFGQIILAAPDIDRDLFLDLANLYPMYSERTTLYASNADKPVHLSSKFHDAPRAGYFEPYTTASNIDTIAVPNFDVDLLGHGYFAQADALLYDIAGLIRQNEPPLTRQRIVATSHNGMNLWELRR